ncbi:DUF3556 domain-containing protein [Streptomyces sp. NPDC001450]
MDAYDVRDGETVAGAVLGWDCGDGHLQHEQLLRAVQERCHYEPGELRVIVLESQPMQRQCQHYRIVDAATGPIEEGCVTVADMVARRPWLAEDAPAIPVRRHCAPATPAPAAAHE